MERDPRGDALELIRRCQAGDEQAFADLFHQYKNLVYKIAYLMLDDADEAEDVLQEVFFQVYKSLSTFEHSKGAFTTWLYRVTVNECINRRRKHRLLTINLEKVSPLALADHPSFPDQLEDEEAIRQALSRLSEKLRAVVILRYYSGLSYAEIAQILNIPVGTVKSRLDLALKTLRKELEAAQCAFPLKEVAK